MRHRLAYRGPMGGQVLGGGVIVLVAVLLWLVYLLPTWHSRRQYDAAERNAVRLSQALRVLAETSETPDEVRLELNARTAKAQQRIARKALAEREELAKLTQTEHEQARTDTARRDLAAARALPAARRARARRRARIVLNVTVALSLSLIGWGIWGAVTTGIQVALWSGVVLLIASGVLRRRMAVLDARSAMPVARTDAAPRAAVALQDVELAAEERGWAPRELPRPLTASAGSRAAAEIAVAEAQDALRQAALDEAMRARAEARAPRSIERVRQARRATELGALNGANPTDDAAIEAHVRDLLERRASGE